MNTIEVARKLAAMGGTEDAIKAYTLVIGQESEPAEKLEAAVYILQYGGNYRISYTAFIELFNQGYDREDILPLMIRAFYEPNVKLLKGRYERNIKLLKKYPYIFRKDFLPFEDLPICFFPYDDKNGYVPFYLKEERFGEYINLKNPVVSRNFFRDLEKPILADNVFSQYELEYLNDNVRKSEYIGRENHIYLHYPDWPVFCAYLQCLNLRELLADEKFVFLIGEEIREYPIDFKARFGKDYSDYSLRPVGIREVNRMIWHTQLSTHNGGDFFNEVFDYHPNLLVLPSMMMSNAKEVVDTLREEFDEIESLSQALERFRAWNAPYLVEELYRMKGRTDKDFLVAVYMQTGEAMMGMDRAARISPAIFFQPHFSNVICSMSIMEKSGKTMLDSNANEEIRQSTLFRDFKYIKTFTPMRRFTTSHGATVRFMFSTAKAAEAAEQADETLQKVVVGDAISQRILNRTFMIDPEDRLYKDSILVRFEDGKLNPKATFTALAAFLDLPYTESMTYCSEGNRRDPHAETKGFDPAPVYKTYDDYMNDAERFFIEYFLRDAYEYYGYDFQVYDGSAVDAEKLETLISGFSKMNYYIRETWKKVFAKIEVSQNNQRVDPKLETLLQEEMLNNYIKIVNKDRLEMVKGLLRGLEFINRNGQPLQFMRRLELDPALLEQPLYH